MYPAKGMEDQGAVMRAEGRRGAGEERVSSMRKLQILHLKLTDKEKRNI